MEIHDLIDQFTKDRSFDSYLPLFLADRQLTDALFGLVERQEPYPYSDYASWIFSHVAHKDATFIQPFYKRIIDHLFVCENPSVLRSCLNAVNQLEFDDYREAERMDLCVKLILDKNYMVSVQVYAMYHLIPLVKRYPELKSEIDQVIALNDSEATPAYLAAMRKYQKALKKLN